MLFEFHFEIFFECPYDRSAAVNKKIFDAPRGLYYI